MGTHRGVVEAIYITKRAGDPVRAVPSVRAVAVRGLEGDRYFDGTGTWSDFPLPGKNVTLIAAEDIEAVRDEIGADLTHGEHRRNIVVRGVSLLDLLGRRFRVGEVEMIGLRPCNPCNYVELKTAPGVRDALARHGSGGLRAEILNDGAISVGDPIIPAEE